MSPDSPPIDTQQGAGRVSTGAHDNSYPPTAQAWGAVAVLCVLYTLSFVDRNLLSLMAVSIAQDLNLTDAQLGVLYGAAFSVCYAVMGLPLGWALDRYSRRLIIWGGVVFWSFATMVCGLSYNFAMLFTARAAVGAGEAVLIPGSQSVLADTFPPGRLALPMSVFAVGAKIGGGVSFILGGLLAMLFPVSDVFSVPLLGHLKGWQLIFIVAGLPGLIISLAVFAIAEPVRQHVPARRAGGATYGDYFRFMADNARFYIPHHIGIVGIMIIVNAINAWTPAYFVRVYDWKMDQVGFWLGLALAIGPVVGIPFHGAISDKLFQGGRRDGHLHYLKYMLCLAAVPSALVYLVPSPWVSLALVCVSQAIIAAYIGILPTSLQLMVPGDLRGKGASIAMLIGGVGGMAVGPSLIPFLTAHLFHDQTKIGLSLALCAVALFPFNAWLLSQAQKPMVTKLGTATVS